MVDTQKILATEILKIRGILPRLLSVQKRLTLMKKENLTAPEMLLKLVETLKELQIL